MNFAVSPDTQSIYQIFLNNGFIDSYPAVNHNPGYTSVYLTIPSPIPVLPLLPASTIFL